MKMNSIIILTVMADQTVTRGRFSLYDDSANRYLTATIHNLSREDAGIYRCGIYGFRVKDDFYTEINLEVKHGELLVIRYI